MFVLLIMRSRLPTNLYCFALLLCSFLVWWIKRTVLALCPSSIQTYFLLLDFFLTRDIQEEPDIERYAFSTSPIPHGYPVRPFSVSPPFSYGYQDTLRPSTAPLPPTPETPRANPRITSGKRPPPARGKYRL